MKNLILLFTILNSFYNYSQDINISVYDNNKTPVKSYNIVVKQKTLSDKIETIDYFIVNNRDKFKFRLDKNFENIFIEISSLGFKKKTEIIKNYNKSEKYNLSIYLTKKVTELKEVVLFSKKTPYIISKDTISFNAKSYSDGSDKKLQDLLENIPGIDVNQKSGEVKYKGKSIETVTLEGDNLFGKNYTVGTKNINIDIIDQVQAIENYSENKLLKNLTTENKVALNIKLKKDKISFSGNFELGSGFISDNNIAHHYYANVLSITKKYKSFGTASYNNINISYSPFNFQNFNSNIEQLSESVFYDSKVISENYFSNNLESLRNNQSKQLFSNYNAIFKISKKGKLKINLYYQKEKIESFKKNITKYTFLQSNTSDVIESNKTPHRFRLDMEGDFKTSKTSLLKIDIRAREDNISTNRSVILNNSSENNSILDTKNDVYFKNTITYTKKLNENEAIQTKSISFFHEIPQVFKTKSINQDVLSKKTFNVIESLFLKKTKNKNNYFISFGLLNSEKKITTFLTDFDQTLSKNNIKYRKQQLFNRGKYIFSKGKFKITCGYSLKKIKQKLKEEDTYKKSDFTFFEPSINIRYSLKSMASISLRSNIKRNFDIEDNLIINRVFTNIRNSKFSSINLQPSKTGSISVFYLKNDIFKLTEFTANMTINISEGNYYDQYTINDLSSINKSIFLKKTNSRFNSNLSISKFINSIKTKLKFSNSYSYSKFINFINESDLRENNSHFLNNEFSIKTGFKTFFNFENTISHSLSFSENINSENRFYNSSLENTLKLKIKPCKGLFFIISNNMYIPNLANKTGINFLDSTLNFRPKKEKFEVNLIAKNILDIRTYETIQTSDFFQSSTQDNILPRYILLNFSLNF